jgi:hypothetical protein
MRPSEYSSTLRALAMVPDVAAFLEAHPDIAARPDLREKARHAFAFSISATWPIYVNLDSHQPLIAFAIAGVLAHERVHATGTLNESAGFFAECELDRHFRERGKLLGETASSRDSRGPGCKETEI